VSYFTIVFEGDLRNFKGNPFDTDTPFGKPFAVGHGDAFQEAQRLQQAMDQIEDAIERLKDGSPSPP
jgi:hypothetical protein